MLFSFCANDLLYKKNNEIDFEIEQEIDLDDDNKSYTRGYIKFILKNDFVLSKGNLESNLELICDRCNNSFNKKLDFVIDEAIEVINKKRDYPEELELNLEKIFEQVLHTQKINVIDYIREFIIINIPYKNLCSDDCKNDKIISLNLEAKNIDPRWEDLLLYKDKLKEN